MKLTDQGSKLLSAYDTTVSGSKQKMCLIFRTMKRCDCFLCTV